MLKVIQSMSELHFSKLMEVYLEGNIENGKQRYAHDSEEIQLLKAESDFYHYLNSVFFRQKDSMYMIWEAGGRYKAALRLEPYLDGYLLCALETAPSDRRKGFATILVRHTIEMLSEQGSGILYSHVSKRNTASLAVHHKCGFNIVKNHAVYSDGSVLHSSYTFARTYEKAEI